MTPRPRVVASPSGIPGSAYAALGTLALIWGFSFVLIKYGLQAMPPPALALVRVFFAAIVLAGILAVRRRNPFGSLRRTWPGYLIAGLFGSALPFFLISWGEQYIGSGLAAILNATTPLWTAAFAYWVTPTERPNRLTYAGVALGFVGAVILVSPSFAGGGLRGSAIGAIAVVVASACYAVSALGQRRLLAGIDGTEASLWQMAFAGLLLVPVTVSSVGLVKPLLLPILAIVVLGAVGSGVANILYFHALNHLGGTGGASVTFLVPMTAVIWGVVLFGERLSAPVLVGMGVILAGVALTVVSRRGGGRAMPAMESESAA